LNRIAASPASSAAPKLRAAIRSAGFVGLGTIAILIGLGNVLARAPADATNIAPAFMPPSSRFPFGTDILGRDMASETLHALAVTATTASFGAVVTVLAGGLVGFLAAQAPLGGGLALRWLARILGAVPSLLLAILFIALTDRSYAVLAAGLAAAPQAFTRAFDRARELNLSAHTEFARATGISATAVLRRDLVYEFRNALLGDIARALAAVAIILSTVSFFGFGAAPPDRDLGLMIAAARDTYFDAWWTAAFPGLALALFILCARLAAGLEEGERP
jgi:peptide/nickel transport system permease protein